MKDPCKLATSLICLLTILKLPALAMKVSQPRMIVAERSNVTLKCMYNTTGDGKLQTLRVTVYRGIEKSIELCTASFNNSMAPFDKPGAVRCRGQPARDSVSIMFSGMNTSHSDCYYCKVEKMFPLPYTEGTGKGTCIFIKPDVVVPEMKRCPQVTQATLIILAVTGTFLLYSVVITYLHLPLDSTACILGMKEAVDMKCELIHNSDEPATATWTGQRWETGPRQDVEKESRRTEQ